jgi:hypothetical protein
MEQVFIILKTTLLRYLLDWRIPEEVELVVIIFEEVVVVIQASEKMNLNSWLQIN